MEILIEQVANREDIDSMLEVWRRVFEREMGITLTPDSASSAGSISNLLARLGQGGESVGTLSVVDTSGKHELHESLGLKFGPQARVARFTHLAVLRPYRGMNIPLAMMLEAHRRVIVPRQFDYTWLLFDVERAASSFLSRQLGFTLLPQTFVSEYGSRCPLIRDERTQESARVIRQAQLYLEQRRSFYAPENVPRAVRALGG